MAPQLNEQMLKTEKVHKMSLFTATKMNDADLINGLEIAVGNTMDNLCLNLVWQSMKKNHSIIAKYSVDTLKRIGLQEYLAYLPVRYRVNDEQTAMMWDAKDKDGNWLSVSICETLELDYDALEFDELSAKIFKLVDDKRTDSLEKEQGEKLKTKLKSKATREANAKKFDNQKAKVQKSIEQAKENGASLDEQIQMVSALLQELKDAKAREESQNAE